MADIDTPEQAASVRAMFNRIAGRYDLMNRLMTLGQDRRWRRYVVARAAPPPGGRLLDVAAGTGDIAFEALRQDPDLQVFGADFAHDMMRVGQRRPSGARVGWVNADALRLPFPDRSFDAITSGYLARNVVDAAAMFREQLRVIKPGGRIVCLDTSPPPDNLLRPFILFHLRVVIPLLGRLIAGDDAAYTYLPESTESFKTAEELAGIMRDAGLVGVRYRKFMFGTMAVHVGRRPEEPTP